MKAFHRPVRTVSQLPPSVLKDLHSYALGAAAVGVTVLATNQPAAGEIIFTPANQRIAPNMKFDLDLNHDGVIDFRIVNSLHLSTTPFGDDLSIVPALSGNAAWGRAVRRGYFAAALPAGVSVGSGRPFLPRQANMAYASLTAFTYVSGGPWKNAKNRFLGLKFLINGEVHFGWARLSVLADKKTERVRTVLTGYAYETVANEAIVTGQTADSAASGIPEGASVEQGQTKQSTGAALLPAKPMLGVLALGSTGLFLWRNKKDEGHR